MNAEMTEALARLLRSRATAALGTLHAGAPYVSMVPYAIAAEGFLVHVSTLAAHTKDMLADARVSLLVAEAEGEAKSPLGSDSVYWLPCTIPMRPVRSMRASASSRSTLSSRRMFSSSVRW